MATEQTEENLNSLLDGINLVGNSKATACLDSLPNEILLDIFANLALSRSFGDQSYFHDVRARYSLEDRKHTATLHALCLTSKKLRGPAEYVLYSGFISRPTSVKATHGFVRTIVEKPYLQKHVKFLQYDYKCDCSDDQTTTPYSFDPISLLRDGKRLLRVWNRLSWQSLCDSRPGLALTLLAALLCTNIEQLAIYADKEHWKWIALLWNVIPDVYVAQSHEFSCLTTLVLHVHQARTLTYQSPPPQTLAIPKLHPSLKYLQISGPAILTHTVTESQLSALSHLYLLSQYSGIDRIIATVKKCASLKAFECHWSHLRWIFPQDRSYFAELMTALSKHTGTLEFLSLGAYSLAHAKYDHLAPLLGDITAFTSLRILQVSGGVRLGIPPGTCAGDAVDNILGPMTPAERSDQASWWPEFLKSNLLPPSLDEVFIIDTIPFPEADYSPDIGLQISQVSSVTTSPNLH